MIEALLPLLNADPDGRSMDGLLVAVSILPLISLLAWCVLMGWWDDP